MKTINLKSQISTLCAAVSLMLFAANASGQQDCDHCGCGPRRCGPSAPSSAPGNAMIVDGLLNLFQVILDAGRNPPPSDSGDYVSPADRSSKRQQEIIQQ